MDEFDPNANLGDILEKLERLQDYRVGEADKADLRVDLAHGLGAYSDWIASAGGPPDVSGVCSVFLGNREGIRHGRLGNPS